MAFCSNCGTQLADGIRFCPSCGTSIGGSAPAAPVSRNTQVVGMRTTAQVLDFFVTGLGMKEKYKERYRRGVDMLIRDLMPNEAIEFATCAILNFSSSSRTNVCVATTNRRLLISFPERAPSGKKGKFLFFSHNFAQESVPTACRKANIIEVVSHPLPLENNPYILQKIFAP